MRMWMVIGFFSLTIFSLQIFSQESLQKDSIEKKSPPETPKPEDLIHFGDLIDVDVIGSSEYDWRGGLTPEGYLDGLNFTTDPIFAACQTEETVAAEIARGYEKLLRDPQVVVKIIDRSRRPVTLLYGAVKTPQRFQLNRPVKLNELLILSGGMTDKANGEIQILRSPNLSCTANPAQGSGADRPRKISLASAQEGGAQYISVKITDLIKGKDNSNPEILSGDVVTVFESKPIFVTGGVLNPRQIDARSEITVSRAINTAGGLTKNAESKKISVFRVENNETKVIEVDLDQINSGQTKDFVLKPYDIVEVAQKGKSRSKYAPPLQNDNENQRNPQNLPLKVVN